MVECLVEFEYIAAEDDELTLKPGDVIANVQKHSGGWWEGDLNGKHGMFPDNFVKEMKKEAKEKSKDAPGAPGKKAGGHVAELANRLHKDGGIKIGLPGPRVIKRGGDANKRKLRAKVAYSYTPENEDEVALEVGDFVEILKQEEEGWWEGIVNGKQGVFPSNFVAVVDEDDVQSPPSSHSPPSAAAPQPPQDAPMGETVEIPGKKIRGIGLGNIFSDGPIQLRKTGSTRKQNEDIKPAAVEAKEKPETNAQPPKNSVKKNAPPSVPKELPVLPAKEHSQPRDMRDHKYFIHLSDLPELESGDSGISEDEAGFYETLAALDESDNPEFHESRWANRSLPVIPEMPESNSLNSSFLNSPLSVETFTSPVVLSTTYDKSDIIDEEKDIFRTEREWFAYLDELVRQATPVGDTGDPVRDTGASPPFQSSNDDYVVPEVEYLSARSESGGADDASTQSLQGSAPDMTSVVTNDSFSCGEGLESGVEDSMTQIYEHSNSSLDGSDYMVRSGTGDKRLAGVFIGSDGSPELPSSMYDKDETSLSVDDDVSGVTCREESFVSAMSQFGSFPTPLSEITLQGRTGPHFTSDLSSSIPLFGHSMYDSSSSPDSSYNCRSNPSNRSGDLRRFVMSPQSPADVPLELSGLSYARQTPPPRNTFRKRRSRGTPKDSPLNPLHQSTPTGVDKPPVKKIRKEPELYEIMPEVTEVDETLQEKSLEERGMEIVGYVLKQAQMNLAPDDSALGWAFACEVDENPAYKGHTEHYFEPGKTRKSVSFQSRDEDINFAVENKGEGLATKAELPHGRSAVGGKSFSLDGGSLSDSIVLHRHRILNENQQTAHSHVRTKNQVVQTVISVPVNLQSARHTDQRRSFRNRLAAQFLAPLTAWRSRRKSKDGLTPPRSSPVDRGSQDTPGMSDGERMEISTDSMINLFSGLSPDNTGLQSDSFAQDEDTDYDNQESFDISIPEIIVVDEDDTIIKTISPTKDGSTVVVAHRRSLPPVLLDSNWARSHMGFASCSADEVKTHRRSMPPVPLISCEAKCQTDDELNTDMGSADKYKGPAVPLDSSWAKSHMCIGTSRDRGNEKRDVDPGLPDSSWATSRMSFGLLTQVDIPGLEGKTPTAALESNESRLADCSQTDCRQDTLSNPGKVSPVLLDSSWARSHMTFTPRGSFRDNESKSRSDSPQDTSSNPGKVSPVLLDSSWARSHMTFTPRGSFRDKESKSHMDSTKLQESEQVVMETVAQALELYEARPAGSPDRRRGILGDGEQVSPVLMDSSWARSHMTFTPRGSFREKESKSHMDSTKLQESDQVVMETVSPAMTAEGGNQQFPPVLHDTQWVRSLKSYSPKQEVSSKSRRSLPPILMDSGRAKSHIGFTTRSTSKLLSRRSAETELQPPTSSSFWKHRFRYSNKISPLVTGKVEQSIGDGLRTEGRKESYLEYLKRTGRLSPAIQTLVNRYKILEGRLYEDMDDTVTAVKSQPKSAPDIGRDAAFVKRRSPYRVMQVCSEGDLHSMIAVHNDQPIKSTCKEAEGPTKLSRKRSFRDWIRGRKKQKTGDDAQLEEAREAGRKSKDKLKRRSSLKMLQHVLGASLGAKHAKNRQEDGSKAKGDNPVPCNKLRGKEGMEDTFMPQPGNSTNAACNMKDETLEMDQVNRKGADGICKTSVTKITRIMDRNKETKCTQSSPMAAPAIDQNSLGSVEMFFAKGTDQVWPLQSEEDFQAGITSSRESVSQESTTDSYLNSSMELDALISEVLLDSNSFESWSLVRELCQRDEADVEKNESVDNHYDPVSDSDSDSSSEILRMLGLNDTAYNRGPIPGGSTDEILGALHLGPSLSSCERGAEVNGASSETLLDTDDYQVRRGDDACDVMDSTEAADSSCLSDTSHSIIDYYSITQPDLSTTSHSSRNVSLEPNEYVNTSTNHL